MSYILDLNPIHPKTRPGFRFSLKRVCNFRRIRNIANIYHQMYKKTQYLQFLNYFTTADPPSYDPCGIQGPKPKMVINLQSGDSTELITSEGYPDNADCEWSINVVEGYLVKLTVKAFDLEDGQAMILYKMKKLRLFVTDMN